MGTDLDRFSFLHNFIKEIFNEIKTTQILEKK